MSKRNTYLILIILFLLLVLIRAYENQLFYDPYLEFFKNDYLYMDSPRREVFKLTVFTTLRYVLNSLLSIAIIYVLFKDKSMVKFSGVIYIAAYLLLIVPFLLLVIYPKQDNYLMFFNIRRFLIQPILLILLLPAFYYYKTKQ